MIPETADGGRFIANYIENFNLGDAQYMPLLGNSGR